MVKAGLGWANQPPAIAEPRWQHPDPALHPCDERPEPATLRPLDETNPVWLASGQSVRRWQHSRLAELC
jgi:hypothetical protein